MMLAFVAVVHIGLFFLIWLVSLAAARRQARLAQRRPVTPRVASPFQAVEAGVSPDGSNHQPPA
jgi:hypothetical protein